MEGIGELRGTGRWSLTSQGAEGRETLVRYDWNVGTDKAWMNALAPVARPLFEWNHDVLKHEGGAFYDMAIASHVHETWKPSHPFLDGGCGIWAGRSAADLAGFLVASKDPAALAAIREKLEHGSGLHRWAAMSAVPRAPSDAASDPETAKLRGAVESLLLCLAGASVSVLLAYVWLRDGRMLNRLLVERGYATVLTIPPNDRFAPTFRADAAAAREHRIGLWRRAGCAS